jgi:dihydrofolate synthase/folylpolyglutamate synthase
MQIESFSDVKKTLAKYMPENISRISAYSLDYIVQLLDYLGNPQNAYRAIHIAGTSGKTSTAYYASALLTQAGYKVGLTVSPHTVEINDRVQINGEPLAEPLFCQELAHFLKIVDESGIEPTYFELMVAFAFWECTRQNIDVAVVEVGLGGLLDATNTITRHDKMCIITDIGLDHTRVLGSTVAEIAAQKAGIIQLSNRVYMYQQGDEVMQAVYDRAKQKQADVRALTAGDVEPPDFLPLFQQRNFGLASAVVADFMQQDAIRLTRQQVHRAAHVQIPGRMEKFGYKDKTIILDGAHNGQKITALLDSLQAQDTRKTAFLLGFVDTQETKNRVDDIVRTASLLASRLVITEFGGEKDYPRRSVRADQVAHTVVKAGMPLPEVMHDPIMAMQRLLSSDVDTIVVAGSLYLLNHIRPYVIELTT